MSCWNALVRIPWSWVVYPGPLLGKCADVREMVYRPLSIQAGDILNLLERIGSDWYSGENTRTGGFGDFPASSVTVIGRVDRCMYVYVPCRNLLRIF